MATVRNLMAMIQRHKGVGDPNERLPDVPARWPSLESLPQMPPEQTARLEHARKNARILNRINDELDFHLGAWGRYDPLIELPTAQDQSHTDEEHAELVRAYDNLQLELADRPSQDAVDKLRSELDTVKADLKQHRKDLAERPTQKMLDTVNAELAARDVQLSDAKSKLQMYKSIFLDPKKKQLEARRETSLQNSMSDRLRLSRSNGRLHKENSTLQSQLQAAHKKVKQSADHFRRLANEVQYAEEMFKSWLWYANTDRNQTERDSARLQRQNEEQTRKYELLHADAVEDLCDQITTSEEIKMYKWAWLETMRFIYHLLGLNTDDLLTDDQSESVFDITRRRLRQCQVVKYEIDKTQKECMDKYEAVCERWKNSKECFQQLNEAMVMIKSLTSDVSRYKTVAITQEARYQATLRERNMFALALRDTKSQFNRLVTITQGAVGST